MKTCETCQLPKRPECSERKQHGGRWGKFSGGSCPNYARHERRLDLVGRWPIPPRYAAATLDDVKRDVPELAARLVAFLAALRGDLDGIHGSIVMTGAYGAGKTWAAAALARRAFELGIPTAFAPVQEILDRLKASFAGGRGGASEGANLAELQAAELLVLDDLGKQRSTEYAYDVLWSILSKRHDQGRPTIITTNLAAAELAVNDRMASIVDRLAEGGLIVRFSGRSRRAPAGGIGA